MQTVSFPLRTEIINTALYDYRKMSDTKGAQLTPIGMSTVPAGRPFQRKTHENVVIYKLKHINYVIQSTCFENRAFLSQNMLLHDITQNIYNYCSIFEKKTRIKEFRRMPIFIIL